MGASNSNVDPEQVATARTWMTAYADGDVERFLSTMTPGWCVHDGDGSVSTGDDLAQITALHWGAFPEKEVTFLHEVAGPDLVAHHVLLVLVHSGEYYGVAPTGKRVEFREMFFHQFQGRLIDETWRMTYPAGVYDALTAVTGTTGH
jgi:predicted ester cyclase